MQDMPCCLSGGSVATWSAAQPTDAAVQLKSNACGASSKLIEHTPCRRPLQPENMHENYRGKSLHVNHKGAYKQFAMERRVKPDCTTAVSILLSLW